MSSGDAGDDPQVIEGFLPTIADARDAFAWLAAAGFGHLELLLPRAPRSTIQALAIALDSDSRGDLYAEGVLIEVPNSSAAAAGRKFGLLAADTHADVDTTALRADVARLIGRQSVEARIARDQYERVTAALEKLRVALEADRVEGRDGGWRPVDSVPLDTRVLVYIPDAKSYKVFAGRCSTGSSGERTWFIDGTSAFVGRATMWRPIPDPPSAGG